MKGSRYRLGCSSRSCRDSATPGRGGLTEVQRLTDFSANTIVEGMREVRKGLPAKVPDKLRRSDVGLKPVEEVDP
ncbi:MAG: hypothetical protein JRN20_06615 [Nitrososphaerota archaeon]|nr:hypothetical protein [Nitrososphaerota archaeon]